MNDRFVFFAQKRGGFVQFQSGQLFESAGKLAKTHEGTSREKSRGPGRAEHEPRMA